MDMPTRIIPQVYPTGRDPVPGTGAGRRERERRAGPERRPRCESPSHCEDGSSRHPPAPGTRDGHRIARMRRTPLSTVVVCLVLTVGTPDRMFLDELDQHARPVVRRRRRSRRPHSTTTPE